MRFMAGLMYGLSRRVGGEMEGEVHGVGVEHELWETWCGASKGWGK